MSVATTVTARIRHSIAPIVVAAFAALPACSASPPAGCTKDTDCAAGRICGSDGRCQAPGGGTGSDGTSAGGSSGNGGSATSGDCPPCWSGYACMRNGSADGLDYFDGTQNPDGSCTLKPDPVTNETVTITLQCGGSTSLGGRWSWVDDPVAGHALDFFESSLELTCDQT
jgi:hypothetical protein